LDSKHVEPTEKEKFIYLTTFGRKTGKAHTVELWFASSGDRIFLSHEGEQTDWMKNLNKNKCVSVKIGSLKFDANAQVGEGEARETGKRALYEKYYGPASKETIDDWFELSTVIELIPLIPS
jgi:deazaflavin-dependent oxidoreductase (nitroreductase family)